MKTIKKLSLVLMAVLGVGTVTACSHQKGNQKVKVALTAQEKKEVRKQEEALALFLVNNFEDIRKIEFVSISDKGFGQLRTVEILINNNITVYSDLQDNYKVGSTLGTFELGKELPKKRKIHQISKIYLIAM